MPDVAVTLEEQLACVEREIGLRLRVYPRWVASGKMRPASADKEIERMQAVRDTLKGLIAESAAKVHR